MKKIRFLAFAIVLLLASSALAAEETLLYGRFGKLTLYRNTQHPTNVVLFVSGDGGWNLGVIDMARSLAGLDALVVGIDITHYLKMLRSTTEKCSYPAADFENLSKYIQKKLAFEHYHTPILVGYSSGATLVYTLLAQAPPNTFGGGISMGFCPDLPLNKPFCPGYALKSDPAPREKGYVFRPTHHLKNQWIAFQGEIDEVCDTKSTVEFVKKVDTAKLVLLPKVGHGFSVQKNWLPQLRESFASLVREEEPAGKTGNPDSRIKDLPLVEVPAQGPANDLLAVILTGDGGWAAIDREVGDRLASKGIAVVGLNTLKYFWTDRTPDLAGKDLELILRHYLKVWNRQRVVLIGYSLGADVLPFMAGRLPEDLLQQVTAVALLGPSKTVNFEFHLSDWLGGNSRPGLPVEPELSKIKGIKVLCLYGKEEHDSLCPMLPKDDRQFKIISLSGGHHFGGDYDKLAQLIFSEIMGDK